MSNTDSQDKDTKSIATGNASIDYATISARREPIPKGVGMVRMENEAGSMASRLKDISTNKI
ncbi:hypothetical protein RA224_09205 [Achromobacter aegrifaciens]|uniref:hypothetical protein n=1 Tax=Achromobacter aegrifaciens TaxID=1287736 RepID=UPI0027BA7A79|nr:hypothetical protein [Achromobacter aegrifaciens]WLW63581.1 hypothetical protein RA224_09205 [Achromobacter aegrifaciens]